MKNEDELKRILAYHPIGDSHISILVHDGARGEHRLILTCAPRTARAVEATAVDWWQSANWLQLRHSIQLMQELYVANRLPSTAESCRPFRLPPFLAHSPVGRHTVFHWSAYVKVSL